MNDSTPKPAFINVYHVQQAYGGPEEGGWYYDVSIPVRTLDVSDADPELQLKLLEVFKRRWTDGQDMTRDYYSVNARGIYRVRLEDHEGEATPKTRPHYE